MKTAKKPTSACFKDFGYRDSDFDAWLPATQPEKEGTVTVHGLPRAMTFKEMAVHFFGSSDPAVIKQHTLTLPMVEEMIDTRESELKTDGYANFFFVEKADGGVSVACVFRGDGARPWGAGVRGLSYDRRWYADHRLLVCSLDSVALEPSVPVSDLEARVAKLEQTLAAIKELL